MFLPIQSIFWLFRSNFWLIWSDFWLIISEFGSELLAFAAALRRNLLQSTITTQQPPIWRQNWGRRHRFGSGSTGTGRWYGYGPAVGLVQLRAGPVRRPSTRSLVIFIIYPLFRHLRSASTSCCCCTDLVDDSFLPSLFKMSHYIRKAVVSSTAARRVFHTSSVMLLSVRTRLDCRTLLKGSIQNTSSIRSRKPFPKTKTEDVVPSWASLKKRVSDSHNKWLIGSRAMQ